MTERLQAAHKGRSGPSEHTPKQKPQSLAWLGYPGRDAGPWALADWWARTTLKAIAVAIGLFVCYLVIFGSYERSIAIAGRTEVLTIRSDGSAFATWSFPQASLALDPEAPASTGPVEIQLARGAEARLVRMSRAALTITFANQPGHGEAARGGCASGAEKVGSYSRDNGLRADLCDDARVRIESRTGDEPIVISLRGAASIGEEVRAGAGAQPILLSGTAELYARHSGSAFRFACSFDWLEALCERFVPNQFALAAGDAVEFRAEHDQAADLTGFVRLDPDDLRSGLEFDVAASSSGIVIRRLKGSDIGVTESPFERIVHSPVIQGLNAVLAALGVIVYFLRLPEKVRHGGGEHEGPHGAAIVLMVVLAAAPARADQALLRAGQEGQAMLRSRADRCYAITPNHVLGDETAAQLTAPGRAEGEADLLRKVPSAPEDVVLMTVKGLPLSVCPAFEGVRPLDGLLRSRSAATLQLVKADGSIERIALTVQSVDIETFVVRAVRETLAQGMSGGTVSLGDEPAGLLESVDDGGRSGQVARLDRIFERIAPYFGLPAAAGPVVSAGPDWVGAEVVRWSTQTVSLGNRAEQLLAGTGAPWRVDGGGPAEVVLKLSGNTVFDTVTIDAGGLADPPRAVEVGISRSEQGPWQSVALFALEPRDGARALAMAPIRATYVRLRASGVQPGMRTMALAGVRFWQRTGR